MGTSKRRSRSKKQSRPIVNVSPSRRRPLQPYEMYGFYNYPHGVAPMASPYGAYPAPPQDVFYGNDLFYAGYPALNVNLNGYETVKRAKNGVATSPSPKKSDSKQVKATTDMSPGRRVNKIQKQLEYYFSSQNMDSDTFLRESMDGNGWVHIDVITAFNRMNVLGATKELVVEAAFHSTNIEVDTQKS